MSEKLEFADIVNNMAKKDESTLQEELAIVQRYLDELEAKREALSKEIEIHEKEIKSLNASRETISKGMTPYQWLWIGLTDALKLKAAETDSEVTP